MEMKENQSTYSISHFVILKTSYNFESSSDLELFWKIWKMSKFKTSHGL